MDRRTLHIPVHVARFCFLLIFGTAQSFVRRLITVLKTVSVLGPYRAKIWLLTVCHVLHNWDFPLWQLFHCE